MVTKPRILCVDDEPLNLMVLEGVLVPKGYEVIKAERGAKALDIIKEQKIDIVLLDVMMPEMNGYEVCRKIKDDERYRTIPVVMITSLSSKDDRIRGIEAGADDFISKPFDHGEILARIKMLLKVKGLNENLNNAYSNIASLTSYGEDVIKTFSPENFNFTENIDNIVSKIIKYSDDMTDKPRQMIVGMRDEKGFQWYKYESFIRQLNKTILEVDLHDTLSFSKKDDSRILFLNEVDLAKPEYQVLTGKLDSIGLKASSMVCYLSDFICVLAMNYGRDVTTYDASLLENLVLQTLFLRSLSSQIRDIEDAFAYTVHALARAAEANDEDTGNHIVRVGEYGGVIARKLKMPEKVVHAIILQAQVHDVGKIHIPPQILKKPGKFTPEEWEEMKKHTLYGGRILGNHARFAMAKTIALTHHERWDGGGYPNGLKGEQIPLEGRIVNIADQYDALRNARVYKPAFDHQKTCGILIEGDGRTMPQHFDPQVLDAFKETVSQFEELYEKLKG
jgi:response regulator RpfG family c-di-GMP phosphodiesterase